VRVAFYLVFLPILDQIAPDEARKPAANPKITIYSVKKRKDDVRLWTIEVEGGPYLPKEHSRLFLKFRCFRTTTAAGLTLDIRGEEFTMVNVDHHTGAISLAPVVDH